MSALKDLSLTSKAFIAAFILSIASAQNVLELSYEGDLESMDEIQQLLRDVQLIYEMKIASKVQNGAVEEEIDGENIDQVDPNGCRCSRYCCSCCKHIRMRRFRVDKDCCFSVTYLRRNLGILISLTFGWRTLFSKEISVRNPPPVCTGVPYVRRGFAVCIEFYNLDVERRSFSGCGRLLARLFYINIAKFNLGCFRMRFLNDTQQVEAVELPYLDEPQAPMEGPEPLHLDEVLMKKIKPSV